MTADDKIIKGRLNEKKENAGILAASDMVYVHHDKDFILKQPVKLSLMLHIPEESIIKRSIRLIHHENDNFSIISLRQEEISIDYKNGIVTLPLYSFTG